MPWNVPIQAPSRTSGPRSGRRAISSSVMRVLSSSAARSLKVTARIWPAGTRCSTNQQKRSVAVAVLPVPGPEGAFLIAAGPGTGKTATATERFCWLVEHRVPAGQILAVTFNDRAADELRTRITDELMARRPDLGPEVLDGAWIGTFHGICSRLLDEFAYLVGSPRELKVLDETGQRLFEQRLVARLRSGEAAPLDPDSFTALSVDD